MAPPQKGQAVGPWGAPDRRYSQGQTPSAPKPLGSGTQRPKSGEEKPGKKEPEKVSACVKVGPVWITIGPRIEAELAAMKRFVEDVSSTLENTAQPGFNKPAAERKPKPSEARRPSLPFEPAARTKPAGKALEGLGGVDLAMAPAPGKPKLPGTRSAVLLHYDKASGLLFQMPSSHGGEMAFTATEIGTTLEWARRNPRRAGQVAFSLDPVDPKRWQERGDSVDGLFQRKWYSDTTLREMPLGYWMWRADWKLKQLSQGMFYDDATGHRRALRRGEDVPADFPEAGQGDAGCARLWIVCRSMVTRPVGRSALLICPEDVQMACEVRAQSFNANTNSFEDAKDAQPHTSAARVAEYLSRNYDAVCRFVPELLHCKRMAALLAVANWLLENHIGSKELATRHCIPQFSVPKDFPDENVPALRAVHETGLREETVFNKLDKELNALMAEVQAIRKEKHLHVEESRMKAERQKDAIEATRKTLDQSSSTSVASYNSEVARYNQLLEKHKALVESYNTYVTSAQQKLDLATKKRNAAAVDCNAVRTTCILVGGVDLQVGGKVEEKPVAEKSDSLDRQVRSWAQELKQNAHVSSLLAGRRPPDRPRSLPDEVREERKAAFNVFPIAAGAA